MKIDELILRRFKELETEASRMPMKSVGIGNRSRQSLTFVNSQSWQRWATSVLSLLQRTFGTNSDHYQNFKRIYDKDSHGENSFKSALGVFQSAKADYEGGYIISLESAISGEIFGDFIVLSKLSLKENQKDVAAVLACAALEDALKRYAKKNELEVDDKSLKEVVSALKSKGLVGGAQKTLLDTMPKIRDYAMHANWDKFKSEDVRSVIGFVEEFLLQHFS